MEFERGLREAGRRKEDTKVQYSNVVVTNTVF